MTEITTETGLIIEDLSNGDGTEAKGEGQAATVHYTGWLEDGTKFDSSVDRNDPFHFSLATQTVIKGWDEGIIGMKVGGKRKLTIPSTLAYGSAGVKGLIPGDATLIFELELMEISE